MSGSTPAPARAALANDIARTILFGFDKHYRLFREAGAKAKDRFLGGDWAGVREGSQTRIQMYDRRVVEAVDAIRARFPEVVGIASESIWPAIKIVYIGLLHEHLQPECAETFYNSVACRVLDRRYYGNEFIFRRPAISTEHLEGREATYRCYYPRQRGLRTTIREVLLGFGLRSPFQDLDRDVRCIVHALRSVFPGNRRIDDNFQFQVLSSLFFRGRAAHVVGRALNGNADIPFVVPLTRARDGSIVVDTVLLRAENIGRVFSLARSYFMVDMEVPSAYVEFLKWVLPNKPKAELYTMLGLQKQGKTLFFRDLVEHTRHSTDRFVVAPGAKGMVMAVFTLPSFPYVFKVIRDWFEPPKDSDRASVKAKYLLVKYHDRAGRMADTLEFSNVALPRNRFDPALVAELQRVAPSAIELDDSQIVIRHVYIERRMTPLDEYVKDADEARLRAAVQDYGDAIVELAGAGIFPGDMLPKNFGVTRYGRVVFYDYDEIAWMTDCNFRCLPEPSSFDEETAGEPWFSVGPHDVFPQQLSTLLFPPGIARKLLSELHPKLGDPAFWVAIQDRIRAGIHEEVLPYPKAIRFSRRFEFEGTGPVSST